MAQIINLPVVPVRAIPETTAPAAYHRPKLVAGTEAPPPRVVFKELWCAARIDRAWHDYVEAMWLADYHSGGSNTDGTARRQAFDEMQASVIALARQPAPTRLSLDQKRHTIGRAWLGMDSTLGAFFRQMVAQDEARLKSGRMRKGEA